LTIFTASYEGRSLDDFLADLRARGVRLVADVREAPISRKRGFSKTALSDALRGAGIAYLHIRALGCPKVIRDRYREDGDWVRYTQSYMKHLRQQQSAVEGLVAATDAQPTALLCYEADFNRCHRTYVAHAVAAQSGSAVCHITAAGLIKEAADSAVVVGRSGSQSATARESGGWFPSGA
jgi:uncharacterized protein (DUF488 family)